MTKTRTTQNNFHLLRENDERAQYRANYFPLSLRSKRNRNAKTTENRRYVLTTVVNGFCAYYGLPSTNKRDTCVPHRVSSRPNILTILSVATSPRRSVDKKLYFVLSAEQQTISTVNYTYKHVVTTRV